MFTVENFDPDAKAPPKVTQLPDLGTVPVMQAAMVEVHGPWHRRWSSTLPEVARTRLERFALLAAFLAVVLLWFRYRGDRLELETWWPPLVGGRTLGLLGISLVFLWLRSGWKRFIDNDHRPDPYEETAVLASGLVTICAGLGLLGLLLCVGRAGLDLNGYTGTDGVALLREQLVHLRGQLAVVSTYLGMTCFGLVTHARIVAAARHYRAQEDDLLDELAQPEQPVLGDRQPTPTTTP